MPSDRETPLMRQIRDAVSRTGLATLWRNNCGVDTTHGIRYGLGLGSADLIGFMHRTGRFLALEVKTQTGRLSEQQKTWLSHVRAHGGIAEVVRSVDEAMRVITEAC